MKKRRIYYGVALLAIIAFLTGRIYTVNQNSRIPIVNKVEQGGTVSYRGLEYRVKSAVLWDYEKFFEHHEDFKKYELTELIVGEVRILVVELQVTVKEKNAYLSLDIPIQYAHTCNWADPFLAKAMNPDVGDGIFQSGESIMMPYMIYRLNLTKEQWSQVEKKTMEYGLILGVYPKENILLVNEIK